ncbi:hypothetical protein MMC13_002368 [Lambiella insularis]|nr:hypothetical protein [Lambiella insularis]
MKLQGRPHSDIQASEAVVAAGTKLADDGDVERAVLRLGLKRACSDSSTQHRSASSTKPSFKIELPPPRYLPICTLKSAQPSRFFFTAEFPRPSHPILDTPNISGYRASHHEITTPLATPSDEKIANMSGTQINQSQESQENTQSEEELGTLADDAVNTDREPTDGIEAWLGNAIHMTVSSITDAASNESITLVAQTLPAPISQIATKPNEPMLFQTSAFFSLMSALQQHVVANTIKYIQVLRAVPTGFNLNSVPSSPVSTSGHINVADGYFASRIFTSTTVFVDRHDQYAKYAEHTPAVSSPSLAVPPSTTHFSLLERFIPPSSTQEFLDLFSTFKPSVLADRIAELSPNGTLLFIYPTKRGAETFKSDYLSPILDPVLRNVVTRNGMSARIGVQLGSMPVIEHMGSFEDLGLKIGSLLQAFETTTGTARYSLRYATKSFVHIHKKVWTEWYIKQESSKIRHVTTQYLGQKNEPTGHNSLNQVMLMREIIEGIEQRTYGPGEGPGPEAAIEVGIFVIKRTA